MKAESEPEKASLINVIEQKPKSVKNLMQFL
jgi:hypothetical protein